MFSILKKNICFQISIETYSPRMYNFVFLDIQDVIVFKFQLKFTRRSYNYVFIFKI